MKVVLGLLLAGVLFAQTAQLERAMHDAAAAWNRGDLATFAAYYDDSPQTMFIGREVTRGGVQAILDRYKRSYSTPEKMGKLTYSEMEVRPLGSDYALMTGKFELKASAGAGGDAAGRYTLVWKKTAKGWKIIHDHTVEWATNKP
jgi:uncharacterized protein (TIGR02246 family)